jgi:anti-sigma factor RsiW
MTTPDPAEGEATAVPEPAARPEPDAHAGLLEAVRTFVLQVMQDVRSSLLRSIASYAATVMIGLAAVCAGAAMAATGAVLLVKGAAAYAAGWLGSVAAADCVTGTVFLVFPVGCALLAYRVWRR